MISDKRVRRLRELMERYKRLNIAAAQGGMDEKSARKYLRSGRLPSEMAAEHTWRTREDPFAKLWSEARGFLEMNEGLEAKTLFEHFQRLHPGQYADGQLRTFQRKVRQWRGLEGPTKEVFFAQEHHPGDLCESDFTYMHELGVTIGGLPFDHLVYHFALTYSNWETAMICCSESFESLSEGLQNALWELGCVPGERLVRLFHELVHPEGRWTSRCGLPTHRVDTQHLEVC